MDTKSKLVLKGQLVLWSQEGGYASPTVEIGGEDLAGELWRLFERYSDPATGEIGKNIPGKWKITLEALDKP